MVPATLPNRRLTRPAAWASAVFIAALCAVNLWYFHAETHPPTFDDAWYLEASCRLYHALRTEGPRAFYQVYSGLFRFKAPLLSVLPLPFYYLLGPSHNSALLVNLFALVLLGTYLYLLGNKLFSATAGFLAVVITMTMPLISGLAHRFLVEFALAGIVTASVYHLLAAEGFRRRRQNRVLGVLLGTGLLLKVLYPLFILGPVLDVLWRRYRELKGSFFKTLETPLKKIIIWGGLIALTWYAHNLLYTVGYIFRASFGDIASHYGNARVWDPAVIFRYWDHLIKAGVTYYYFLAGTVITVILTARDLGEKPPGRLLRESVSLRILLPWLLIPLFLGTLGVNKAIRFMTPCLPAFALLLAGGLDRITFRRRYRPLALLLFFVIPAAEYSLQEFGLAPLPALKFGPAVLLTPGAAYSGPPSTAGQLRQQELVDAINRETSGAPAVVAVGTEVGWINANNLSYYSARRGYPFSFISYGYEERRVERTVARLKDKDANYILLIDGLQSRLPPNVRILEPQLRKLIAAKRLPFAKGRSFRLTPEITATLYHRTSPIRLYGAPGPAT